jgi:hypothetical protein
MKNANVNGRTIDERGHAASAEAGARTDGTQQGVESSTASGAVQLVVSKVPETSVASGAPDQYGGVQQSVDSKFDGSRSDGDTGVIVIEDVRPDFRTGKMSVAWYREDSDPDGWCVEEEYRIADFLGHLVELGRLDEYDGEERLEVREGMGALGVRVYVYTPYDFFADHLPCVLSHLPGYLEKRS